MILDRVTTEMIAANAWQRSTGGVLRDYIAAISLHQPYASWMADGSKPIETRRRATRFRGDILICSTLNHSDGRVTDDMRLGVALCIVEVYDCRPMTKADEPLTRCSLYPFAHCWMTRNLRRLAIAPRVVGKQGIFFVRTKGIVLEAAA